MTREFKQIPAIVLAVITAVLLAACQQQGASSRPKPDTAQKSASTKKIVQIGYSLYDMNLPWAAAYKKEFERALKEHPNWKLTWLDGNSDSPSVAAGVEKWVAEGIDLVISMSPDHVPLRTTYGKALQAGIPILLTGDSPDYRAYPFMTAFSGYSAWDAGRMAAELLDQALGGKGRVACITGPRGSASERQTTEGFTATLKRLGSRIQVAATEDGRWDSTVSYQKTLAILARFPKIDAIYACEDAMASAVIRALREKGYPPGQVKVVAQGGSRGTLADLKEGWYLGIVNQDPSVCAQQDIWLIRALVEERRRLPSFVQAPQEMITKENAGLFVGW